ncbi:MAG TPA: TonB-dependent receptor [Dinghuibacter sp.]|uniref:SusC/RagA family TonB-linked outer membrane protein n=1 Tax=Dinghuibacter sp. TaxID=2024697 RepID=UPI002D1D2E30|nr:TonB-dependent receptor [Dinghuibacter sp.]HTJ12978.1 TonB-dependent receptor [Dinghuibacter sp.]
MKKAIALFFLTCLCSLPTYLWAQTLQVTGKVVSKTSGSPLAGASVRIKGTDQGTVTDAQGKFIINTQRGKTLVITYLGEETQEIKVGEDLSPTIALVDRAGNLEDVVVVGYGTQKKSVVTGAISTVKSKDIENMPVSRVDQALEGRVAGVTVQASSGAPGAAPTVNIRGITSINGNTPLYVVDGTIVDVGGLDYLNPADIENIEILKDAASTAIYGSRGGPGVVLVTTKHGKSGQATISYSGSLGTQAPMHKLSLTNAEQYATLRNESSLAAGNGIVFANPQSLGSGTDWQSQIFNNHAMVQNHDLSFSGGSDKGTYYTSIGYYDQQGIVATSVSDYKRLTFRVNTEANIRPWFKIGENMGYSYIRSMGSPAPNTEFGGPLSDAINLDPTTPLIETDPTILAQQPYTGVDAPYLVRDGLGRPYGISTQVGQEITNPVAWEQIVQGNYGWSHNFTGNAYINVQPIKGLTFISSFNVKKAFYGSQSFTPLYFLNSSTNNITNTSFYRDADQNLIYNWDNTLTYTHNWGDHHLLAEIGIVANDYQGNSDVNATYQGLSVNTYGQASFNYSLPPAQRVGGGGDGQETRYASYLARVTYNYAEKYLLTANFRRDGSSLFGTNNQFGNFPALSVGWVPSKENFWTGISNSITYFKLRGGYGVNGNTGALAPYEYESTIGGGRNYAFGQAGNVALGYSPNAPANPNLEWEKNGQWDVGFDATVYRHFTVTADYFNKWTSGMLLAIQQPGYSGAAGNPTGNVAKMQNKGAELELGYNNKVGDVNLSVGANLTYVQNTVTNIGTNQFFAGATFQASSYEISRIMAGQHMDEFYGFKTMGIFQTQADVNSYVGKNGPIQPNAKPGDFKYADLDGDGTITSSDRTFLGNPIPDWLFGFNVSANYKNFDLTVFAQGVAGNKIFQGYRRLDILKANYMSTAMNRWTGPGSTNDYPRLIDGDPNGNFSNPSAFYLQNGSYLKIRSVRLGYTLARNFTQAIGFQRIYVYVAGDNLLTFTKYNGFDPEIGGGLGIGTGNSGSYGVDNGVYPTARTFTVGLNVGF